jgi:hypothetical protein
MKLIDALNRYCTGWRRQRTHDSLELRKGRALPNSVVIGAAKSGTSWLYRMFSEHPEIFVPSLKVTGPSNEVSFFTHTFDRGVDYYARYFENSGSFKVRVDVSPRYLFQPDVPIAERMHALLPEARLVASLRDPVTRAWSRFRHSMRNGTLPPWSKFREVIKDQHFYDLYIRYGFYADHLERYWEYYPRSQVKVVFYEDMASDPRSYLKDVLAFLEVDADFEPPSLTDRVNANRASYLSALMAYALVAAGRSVGKLVVHAWSGHQRPSKFPARRVPMDHDVRAFLEDTYAEPNARLCALLGRPVPFVRS